jgi:hypothetical protein
VICLSVWTPSSANRRRPDPASENVYFGYAFSIENPVISLGGNCEWIPHASLPYQDRNHRGSVVLGEFGRELASQRYDLHGRYTKIFRIFLLRGAVLSRFALASGLSNRAVAETETPFSDGRISASPTFGLLLVRCDAMLVPQGADTILSPQGRWDVADGTLRGRPVNI